MKIAFAATGVLLAIGMIVAGLQDINREWKPLQAEFQTLALSLSKDDVMRESISQMDTGIKQDYIPELGRVDRCRTCHLGIQNPIMAKAPQPHTKHPGKLLESHPPERFGCTICHQGQGLATTTKDAHAREIPFWEEPMYTADFIEASCEKCHTGSQIKGASIINDGRKIAVKKGCAGCHKYYAKGGMVGPELTGIGNESIYIKHPIERNLEKYKKLSGGDTNIAYILEAIKEPAAQPEDTKMPVYELSNWEIRALATYTKSLSKENIPSSYKPESVFLAEKPGGHELYIQYCSACHGSYGEGGLEVGRMGISLNNEEFLALASPAFLQGVIIAGRNSKDKVMPAWGAKGGGLTPVEVGKIRDHILSWRNPVPPLNIVLQAGGKQSVGKGLYRRNCADCHGSFRQGKIGPSLSTRAFLQIASDRFIVETMLKGRRGTAMPAWNWMLPYQIDSLFKFLKIPEKAYTPLRAVSANGSIALGRTLFQSRCAVCHASNGRGDIGPSIDTPEFAALAGDDFIIKTILNGRKDAGMPAWKRHEAEDISAIAAFVGSLSKPRRLASVPEGKGSASKGKNDFLTICSNCHGIDGNGGTGPAIAGKDFIETATDRFIAGIIKYGRSSTEMRPMGNLPGPWSICQIKEL